MNEFRITSLFVLLSILLTSVFLQAESKLTPTSLVKVSSSWGEIVVKSVVPYPLEVENEDQARVLSKEAALTQAQSALLTYLLAIETKSGRSLSVAQIPSLELQEELRLMVKNATVKKTQYKDRVCTVWLELDKSGLKKILKEN